MLSNDIERNHGSDQPLNILYANINSLSADLKLRMKADNILWACLSETGC
jgi:hypothetical protein